jgi:hypothetical protein
MGNSYPLPFNNLAARVIARLGAVEWPFLRVWQRLSGSARKPLPTGST